MQQEDYSAPLQALPGGMRLIDNPGIAQALQDWKAFS